MLLRGSRVPGAHPGPAWPPSPASRGREARGSQSRELTKSRRRQGDHTQWAERPGAVFSSQPDLHGAVGRKGNVRGLAVSSMSKNNLKPWADRPPEESLWRFQAVLSQSRALDCGGTAAAEKAGLGDQVSGEKS